MAAGRRPWAGDIARWLESPCGSGSPGASISHRPPDAEGWIELLASGLTFDLSGLMPARPAPPPCLIQAFGLPEGMAGFAMEALRLVPGAHIAAGGQALPVVRIMAGLAARLAGLPDALAVCWHPAGTWMAPDYFSRIVFAWLAGGAFPALGLTGLDRLPDGLVQSRGLAYFIGREIRFRPEEDRLPAESIRQAVRIVDWLVAHGALREPAELAGIEADGGRLRVVPDPSGQWLDAAFADTE